MWDEPPKSHKARSEEHEERLSAELGFSRQIMSGALPQVWRKEDGVDDNFMYQLKETVGRDARVVKLEDLHMLTCRAYTLDKLPVLLVTFTEAETPTPQDWALVPVELWKGVAYVPGD